MIIRNDEDLERAILAAILNDKNVINEILKTGLNEKYFYSQIHQRIFSAIMEADSKCLIPDVNIVTEILRKRGQLDDAERETYIKLLPDAYYAVPNLDFYIQTLKELFLRRNILKLSVQMKRDVVDRIDPQGILEKIQIALFDLYDKTTYGGYSLIEDLLSRTLQDIDITYKNKNPVCGIPSGYSSLDYLTGGFQAQDYIVFYGIHGIFMVQTLTLGMISHISVNKRIPAAYFSLGTSDVALMKELIALDSGINHNKLRSGFLTTKDFIQLQKSMEKIIETPLFIVDKPDMSILDIYSISRELKVSKNIEIIFIDNYNLIHSEENASISKIIKRLSRELAIPVVLLYDSEAKGSEPAQSDISVWNNIKRDVSTIIYLKEWDRNKATLCLEKNRHDKTGELKIDLPDGKPQESGEC